MSKINKLTKEQESRIKPFINEWLEYVLSPVDDGVIYDSAKAMYKLLDIKNSTVVILDNPIYIALAIMLLSNQLGSQLDSQLRSQLGSQLGSQLCSQLDSQLCSQLDNYYTNVWWASNAGYYEFAKYIGVSFDEKPLDICSRFSSHVYVCFPFENIIFCSRKPTTKWKHGLLHSENSPAIAFSGGWDIYCLNGVKVTKDIVMTKAEELDPNLIVTEKNADVRREIVRKIGIERVCQKLQTKVLDKWENGVYELVDLDLGDGRQRPYLKMRNPSINTWHLEGVPPEIKTVTEALNWRNQSKEEPVVLT